MASRDLQLQTGVVSGLGQQFQTDRRLSLPLGSAKNQIKSKLNF
jgi:hypothetical protein